MKEYTYAYILYLLDNSGRADFVAVDAEAEIAALSIPGAVGHLERATWTLQHLKLAMTTVECSGNRGWGVKRKKNDYSYRCR